jgi:hypothetical protein
MPVKNYTTKVPAARSVQEVQDALVRHGATGVLLQYEPLTRRVASIAFQLPFEDRVLSFGLPVDWRAFKATLKAQQVSKWSDDDHVYRVAWRCVRDWVLAQLAFQETSMVDLIQVFLPYGRTTSGTIYDLVRGQKLLQSPRSDSSRGVA